MPERFDMVYTGADNAEHRPAMIHRALLGSFERFIGILIEHYAGALPLWLAPVQAIVLPVSDRFNQYGARVREQLGAIGARVELDERSQSVARKIRDAELRKIPYMLVVGEKEEAQDGVSVREHRAGDTGFQTVENFADGLRGRLYSGGLKPRTSQEREA
jgi:threonyl-tRNA synthetase